MLVVGKVEHMETIPIWTTLDSDNLRDRGYLKIFEWMKNIMHVVIHGERGIAYECTFHPSNIKLLIA